MLSFFFCKKELPGFSPSFPPIHFLFALLIRGGSMSMAFTASQGTLCSCWHSEATNPNLRLYLQTGTQKPLCMWKEITALEKEKGRRRSTYSLNLVIALRLFCESSHSQIPSSLCKEWILSYYLLVPKSTDYIWQSAPRTYYVCYRKIFILLPQSTK